MPEFINTIDALGDDAVVDSIIERTITEFKDDTLTQIGCGSFVGCASLVAVELPNVTKSSSDAQFGAFKGCTSLTKLYIPELTQIPGRLCDSCSSIKELSFPKATKMEGNYCFSGCTSLESIDLPLVDNSVFGAFNGCSALTRVNLPLLKTANTQLFANCKSLAHICLPRLVAIVSPNQHTSMFGGCTALKVVDVPSVTTIEAYGFVTCSALTALLLRNPEGVCTLAATTAFHADAVTSGKMFVYVPGSLVKSYQEDSVWKASGVQFRALEDYTVDGTVTGNVREYCESLVLDATELTFADINRQTLTPTGIFGVLDEPIIWESSDTHVAIVKNGVVVPVGDGTAVITATCSNVSASCSVIVNDGLNFLDDVFFGISFHSGYLYGINGSVQSSASNVYTDQFAVWKYTGSSIHVQLTNVTGQASNSRICYYTIDNKFISAVNGTSGSSGIVNITSTVPNNAEYAAISIAKNNNFSINITCDEKVIGEVEYTS